MGREGKGRGLPSVPQVPNLPLHHCPEPDPDDFHNLPEASLSKDTSLIKNFMEIRSVFPET